VTRRPLGTILTHGYTDSAATWSAQVDALTRSADIDPVRAWDLPGHGDRRDDPDADTTMAAAVAELTALAGHSPRPLLIGHSAGGYLSLRAIIDGSITAAGLVLISTGPGFRQPTEMARWNESMRRLAASGGFGRHTVDLVTMVDSVVIDGLSGLDIPVLIISGGQDRPAYQAGSSYLARRLPNARPMVVAEAGHHPHRSHPEAVNRAVLDFAAELGRDG
jgi:pimeloyl-ACP methyl ester carboxylesterase